jgi:propanediol utilization protein
MAAVRRKGSSAHPTLADSSQTYDPPVRPMAITQSKVLNQTTRFPCLRSVTVLGHHSSAKNIPYLSISKEVSQKKYSVFIYQVSMLLSSSGPVRPYDLGSDYYILLKVQS